MRKLLILSAAVVVAATAGLVYRAATSEARWHILSETAINTNRLCVDGLRYTWASGETGTQPPATRPVGDPGWVGPVTLVVQAASSSTPPGEDTWLNTDIAGSDIFVGDYAPVKNSAAVPPLWYPYSHKGTVPFRHPRTAVSETVRLDTLPNSDSGPTDAFEEVGDCFLFGPLDFKPADPSNVVDFALNGKPVAAILSTTTFNATTVLPAFARLGATGTEASPLSSSISDVDGDGKDDLAIKFRRSETGLVCGVSTEVMISAIDPASGKRFYEANPIQTTNCT